MSDEPKNIPDGLFAIAAAIDRLAAAVKELKPPTAEDIEEHNRAVGSRFLAALHQHREE